MADPFVAEIRIFPFTFAPQGWAFCDGQILPLSQNTALFSLLGTTYGGNGKSNFALPDLQGSAAMHSGQGPGLSERFLGERSGTQTVTLLESEMPAHNHAVTAANVAASQSSPQNNLPARPGYSTGTQTGAALAYSAAGPNVAFSPTALAPAGGSLPHNNMQPYLALHFCIALQGVFPPRG